MNRETSLASFLNASVSAYHAVDEAKALLLAEGYTPLEETEEWRLEKGGKYFLVRNGASLLAFRIPKGKATGFQIAAAHTDSPSFKYKKTFTSPAFTRLSVERYGAPRNSTWMDRPLSLAGRVLVKKGDAVLSVTVDLEEPIGIIPTVAPHLLREAAENLAVDFVPFVDGEAGVCIEERLAERLGVSSADIVGHDLYLYPVQQALCFGEKGAFISSPRLDDLQCVYGLLRGFVGAEENSAAIPLLALFDSEEVGSRTMQGADSDLLSGTMERIAASLGASYPMLSAGSFFVSADNAHGLHPNHPELSDRNGLTCTLNGGVVIKRNASRRYTTDGLSEALFTLLCKEADVPVQLYANRPDQPGGSTLGAISDAHASVYSVDIGLAQLSMHSAVETAGTLDTAYLEKVMACFFSRSLARVKEGYAWQKQS